MCVRSFRGARQENVKSWALAFTLMSNPVANAPLETAVYVSLADGEMSPVALHGMIAKARSYNRANGITSALISTKGAFIHALEGTAKALDDVLERIGDDPRHKELSVVYRGEIANRAFEDWALGYRNVDDEAADEVREAALAHSAGDDVGQDVLALLSRYYANAYPQVSLPDVLAAV